MISLETIGHYDDSAGSFWEGTKDHDVSQNRDALLRHIHGDTPFRILDLGCGPGRDVLAFSALGHHAFGLDGSANFVSMAKELTGCPILHQDFLSLELEASFFDGIFANASLFHVPLQGAATGAQGTPGSPDPRRSPLRLQPPRHRSGGVERTTLWQLPDLGDMERPPNRKRLRLSGTLLPSFW